MIRAFLLLTLCSVAITACAHPRTDEMQRLQRIRAADLAFQSGDLAKAERLYRTLSEGKRGAESAHVRLGAIAYRRGERERAKEHFKHALRANRDYAPAMYNLAIMSLDESVEYLRRYLSSTSPGPQHDRASELLNELKRFAAETR